MVATKTKGKLRETHTPGRGGRVIIEMDAPLLSLLEATGEVEDGFAGFILDMAESTGMSIDYDEWRKMIRVEVQPD